MSTATSAVDAAAALAELPLLIWLSPAFPVGAFAYSHALEWVIEAGDVKDAASLQAWLGDLLAHGAPRNDAIVLAAAWRAVLAEDDPALGEVNALAVALATSRERHLETTAQGNAFVAAASSAWPCDALMRLVGVARPDVAYPVSVAAVAAGHGLALASTLEAFLLASIANLVSAAVRLGAIGQTDGQRVLAALISTCRMQADFAAGSTLDDLGAAALRSDIAALKHETQYTRLFRS